MGRDIKLDDKPLAGAAGGILSFVQPCRWNADDVESMHLVWDALNEVDHVRVEGNAQFIKRMEMLKLHVDVRTAHIVVEKIEDGIIDFIHADGVLIFIIQ